MRSSRPPGWRGDSKPPSPAILAAFSTEECVWVEQYATSLPSQPSGVAGIVRRAFATGKQRAQRSARSSIVNHAAARAGRQKFLRQPQHWHQPVQDVRLQFRASRTGRPQHPLDAHPRRQQVSKDRRSRRIAGKVCVEVRRLPVRDPRQNKLVHVGKDRLESLASCRSRVRQGTPNLSRLRLRQNRKRFDLAVVVGNPVDHGVAMSPKLVRRHVKRFFVGQSLASAETGLGCPRLLSSVPPCDSVPQWLRFRYPSRA